MVGQVTPQGQITEYPTDGVPDDLTFGLDGNLWAPRAVSATAPAAVDQITTDGVVTSFTAGVDPNGGQDGDTIITGPDGNLWFNDGASAAPAIGKISLQLPPTAITDPASAIDATTATVTGTVDPLGSDTDVTFQYGTSPAFGESTDAGQLTASGSASDVSASLKDLPASTTIYYRAVATSASGTADGATETFTTGQAQPITTPSGPPPTTVTTPVTSTNPTKTKPGKPNKPRTARLHFTVGDQHLTLKVPAPPKPYACLAAATTPYLVSMTARTTSKGAKLAFRSATFRLDGRQPHVAKNLPAHARFSLHKRRHRDHRLTVAVRFEQHNHKPLHRTLTARFRVC